MNKYYEEYEGRRSFYLGIEHEVRALREVRIRGTKTVEMPMWMINNYIKSTCDNYTKLVYILKIIDIYSDEHNDIVDIGISTSSVPVDKDGKEFEEKLIGYVKNPKVDRNNKEKFCLMSRGCENSKKSFWHYFSNCERPVCFAITKNNDIIFLYNPRGDEGIKIREISYHSPIDIVMNGLSGCIDSLVNACAQDRNDRRLQMEHEARMVTQSMQTIKESIYVQEKLQNTNLPEGQKMYLQSMHDALMTKQEKLNEQIGVKCPIKIDTKL